MMLLSALTLLSLSSLLNAQEQQGQQGQEQESDGSSDGAIYSESVLKYKTSVAYTSLPTV